MCCSQIIRRLSLYSADSKILISGLSLHKDRSLSVNGSQAVFQFELDIYLFSLKILQLVQHRQICLIQFDTISLLSQSSEVGLHSCCRHAMFAT